MSEIHAERLTAEVDGEFIYNNMPPFGLAKATRAVPATGRREFAPGRMAHAASIR